MENAPSIGFFWKWLYSGEFEQCGTVHYALQSGCNFIQMRATKQLFPMVLFILLYKELVPFESVVGEASSQIVAIQINDSEQYILWVLQTFQKKKEFEECKTKTHITHCN